MGGNSAEAKVFTVLGIGNKSCGYFTNAVANERSSADSQTDAYAMMSWAQGYLTHLNLTDPGTTNIVGGSDPEGAKNWLFNYCRVNPLKDFAGAVDALVGALWPMRERAETKQR